MKYADHIPLRADGSLDERHLILREIMRTRTDLRRKVNRPLENAAVGSGDTGKPLVVTGDLGDGTRGFHVRRRDGSTVMRVYSDDAGGGFAAALFDAHEQYLVTDDATSGYGLARPYIPLMLGPVVSPLAGGVPTTTSTDWTTLWTGGVPLQHPVIYSVLSAQTDPGVTAELRITVDGVPLSSVTSLAAGTWAYPSVGPAATGQTTFAQFHTVNIEGHITAGTGRLAVILLSMYGVESSLLSA